MSKVRFSTEDGSPIRVAFEYEEGNPVKVTTTALIVDALDGCGELQGVSLEGSYGVAWFTTESVRCINIQHQSGAKLVEEVLDHE